MKIVSNHIVSSSEECQFLGLSVNLVASSETGRCELLYFLGLKSHPPVFGFTTKLTITLQVMRLRLGATYLFKLWKQCCFVVYCAEGGINEEKEQVRQSYNHMMSNCTSFPSLYKKIEAVELSERLICIQNREFT